MNPDNKNIEGNNNQPQNIPEQKPKTGDFFIRPLRTYEDDVKNAVRRDSISTAKILMAEQRKKEKEEQIYEDTSPKSKTNITKITLSVFLVILGIGLAGGSYFYFFQNTNNDDQNVSPINEKSLIAIDETFKINTFQKTNREIIGVIRKEIAESQKMKQNNIKEILISKNITVTENEKEIKKEEKINTSEFFTILEAGEPDGLVRSFDDNFIIGIHKTKDAAEPFILLRSNDFENSYAGMLEWEKRRMIEDIKNIFYINLGSSQIFADNTKQNINTENVSGTQISTSTEISISTNVATGTLTTGTSSVQNSVPKIEDTYDARDFKDLIISNKDIRAILNKDGKIEKKNINFNKNL